MSKNFTQPLEDLLKIGYAEYQGSLVPKKKNWKFLIRHDSYAIYDTKAKRICWIGDPEKNPMSYYCRKAL